MHVYRLPIRLNMVVPGLQAFEFATALGHQRTTFNHLEKGNPTGTSPPSSGGPEMMVLGTPSCSAMKFTALRQESLRSRIEFRQVSDR